MCAEAVWWRCHRRIIADYLLAGGDEVFHILGRSRVDRALMTLPRIFMVSPQLNWFLIWSLLIVALLLHHKIHGLVD
jgi:hypothetical protein